MLNIHGLSKSFDKEDVLINFNLDIESSEIISVVGGSGSGKTTLLRLISGLVLPDNGKIILNNKIVNDESVFVPPEKRACSLVFQDYALFPNISMRDNIYFGKNSKKLLIWNRFIHTQKEKQKLCLFSLDPLLNQPPKL